jgi:hypothetical protein
MPEGRGGEFENDIGLSGVGRGDDGGADGNKEKQTNPGESDQGQPVLPEVSPELSRLLLVHPFIPPLKNNFQISNNKSQTSSKRQCSDTVRQFTSGGRCGF